MITVTNAGAFSAAAGRDFPLHVDPAWEIHFYRAGTVTSVIGGSRHPVQPGSFTVVPPGVLHGEIAHTGYQNYYVQLDAPADAGWPRTGVDDADASIGTAMRTLVREYQAPRLGSVGMMAALVAQLDVLLRRQGEQATLSRSEQLVRAAEWVIGERFNAPLTVARIADEVGVSTSRLRAAFAECRDGSPLDALHRIRAERATWLLRTTSSAALTLEAIAYSCGYDSASHLNRHIRRHTGRPPGQLRGRSGRNERPGASEPPG